MKIKKVTSFLTAMLIGCSVTQGFATERNTAYAADAAAIAEYLDRGISAINTGSGMMVSWRFLASDATNTTFKLYRNNELIYTSETDMATCYLDKNGKSSSSYRVDAVVGGKVVSSDECGFISGNNYFNIPMDVPKAGADYTYSPNDCSTGDVDGDGVYEIFVKWDPSNSKDNSQSGHTGNVYIDCYKLTGQKLWRIDLGKNIRAGAHYTQFLVADFDCDGKAEMTCKTADGTVDGVGKVIGDASKDYRNGSGYILSGPEYYTLFDGATGAALDTVNYEYPRGEVKKSTWGDDYGNRCDRFLGAVMYCDGVKPSAVSVRGYYTRMTAVAYDVVDKKLVKRWGYDTGFNNLSAPGYSDGNHNCMPADVDGDGKQELVLGATCIDDNGKVLWCNELGHGDAMHLSDFLPDRPGFELWVCHEHQPWGVSLLDAKTGKKIFHYDHSKDTGRCGAGNIYAGNPGAEFWGANAGTIYDGNGKSIGNKRPAMNFMIYWDGDLEREILDWIQITKYTALNTISIIFTADGCESNNSTKSNPCLTADLLGDWREEVVYRTSDNKALRVYTTPHTTDYRITTLMHDIQYRTQVAAEQTSYNQPPHPSFYLGSDEKLPERPEVIINGNGTGGLVGAEIDESISFMLKNGSSGLYLSIAETAGDGVNVVQSPVSGIDSGESLWRAVSNGDGYYRIYNCSKSGEFLLDVANASSESGANIGIWSDTACDAQLFKFIKQENGSYVIVTKTTNDKSAVEVVNASSDSGANVQQWEKNGHDCQTWFIEKAVESAEDVTLGDVNEDGAINVFDVIMQKRMIGKNDNSRRHRKSADVNADTAVNADDCKALSDFLMKRGTLEASETGNRVYYAVDQAYNSGIEESSNAGFKYDAYLNLDNKIGSFTEWNVNVPTDGNYLCTFHIANGSANDRKMKIEVNNGKDHWVQPFLTTSSWTSWEERGIVLPLVKGKNVIRTTSLTAEGGPNMDYLKLEWTDEPIAEIYIPEE